MPGACGWKGEAEDACGLVPAPDSFLSPQAIRGEAFDRHLLGLKLQAIEDLVSMPDIFMDTSYAVATHFTLSTSQVGTALRAPLQLGPGAT